MSAQRTDSECYLAKGDSPNFLWWTGTGWSPNKADRMPFTNWRELETYCRDHPEYERAKAAD